MLVEWARSLTELGLWVLRFDYRGHGDSGGVFHDYALHDFVDDIQRAMDVLEQRAGVPCRGLCGLRLGATLAAQVWADDPRPGPLVLWEPVLSGPRYLDELLMGILAKNMAQKAGPRTSRTELRQRIARGDPVIFEGRLISRELSRSLEALDLVATSERLAKPTLWVQIRKRQASPPQPLLLKIQRDLQRRGRADFRSLALPLPWFGSLVLDYAGRVSPRELFQVTRSWMGEQISSGLQEPSESEAATPSRSIPALGRSARWPQEDRLATGAACERPICFDVDGVRCRGMLHVPADVDLDRPVIVMPPQGMNLRTGWNQLHVRLARMLGTSGWSSLRFDARGLGQSDGELDFATGADLFFALENGFQIPDTRAAIDWVEQTLGSRSVILLGVCGGAVTAGFLGVNDPRLAAVALLELPLLHSRHPAQRAGKPLWRYREPLLSPQAWRRLLTLQIDFRVHLQSLHLAASRWFRSHPRDSALDRWLSNQLGATANLALAGAVRRCCTRGIPVLFAFGSTDNARFFDRVKSVLCPADSSRIGVRVIEGADHDFLLPEHAQQLGNALEEWLNRCFNTCQEAMFNETGDCHPELPHA